MIKSMEEFIHSKIPLSQNMGFSILEVNKNQARIFFPLAPNINHHGTAFGGSLSAAHLLASYVWFFNFLEQQSLKNSSAIVVKESQIQFIRPVDKDFIVTCLSPDQSECDQFLKLLQSKGKARLNLESQVYEHQVLLSFMKAQFVATQPRL